MTENRESAAKIDPLAEFHRLKEESAVINAKMRASAPLLNSSVSSSDALLGIILKELKAMRVEVKRIEENQERIQEDVTENKENLKVIKEDIRKMKEEQDTLHEELREVKEAQKQSESKITENLETIKIKQESHDEKLGRIQEDLDEKHESLHKKLCKNESAEKQFKLEVTENQKTIMLKMDKIQEDVTSCIQNQKEIDKNGKTTVIPETPIELDIKKKVYGKWQKIGDSKYYFCAKFEGNKFFYKWGDNAVEEYTLGVKDSNGCIVTVENDKIIQKWIYENGEEKARYEYHMEDKKLERDLYFGNSFCGKVVYERVGDPDFA